MKDGSRVVFDQNGGLYSEEWSMDKVSRHIIGRDQDGRSTNVDLSKAIEVEAFYKSSNVGGTILGVLGGIVLLFVVTVAVYLSLNPIRS
jgi:hypothetical protein